MILGWTSRQLPDEIRNLLRAMGKTDVSDKACKAWVRVFIHGLVWAWPGRPMRLEEEQLVGRRFQELLCEYGLVIPDGRQERFARRSIDLAAAPPAPAGSIDP